MSEELEMVEKVNKWVKENKAVWDEEKKKLIWIYNPKLFKKLMEKTVPSKEVGSKIKKKKVDKKRYGIYCYHGTHWSYDEFIEAENYREAEKIYAKNNGFDSFPYEIAQCLLCTKHEDVCEKCGKKVVALRDMSMGFPQWRHEVPSNCDKAIPKSKKNKSEYMANTR